MLELLAPSLTPLELLGAAGAASLAGFIRAFAGFGFALASVPLLSGLMPPSQAVPLVLMLELASGLQLVPEIRRDVDWPATRVLLAAALVFTPPGVWLLAVVPAETMRLILSVMVLTATAILASGWRAPGSGDTRMALAMGTLSGVLNGSSAMCGPPVLFYYLARGTPAVTARASMLMYFFATGIMALAASVIGGLVGPDTLGVLVISLPGLALATVIGQRMFRRTRDGSYRSIAIGLLGLIGLSTLIRTLLVS